MARYPLGQPVRLSSTIKQRNVDGTETLVNPTTAVYTLLRPDQTTATFPSPVSDGLGLIHQDLSDTIDVAQTGPYQWKLKTTGPGAGVTSGSFVVYDPFETELLGLDDAKEHLNIPAATTTYDAELEAYIAATTGAVEGIVGPVGRRTVTETVYPSNGVIQLSTTPVLSLTSVTPYLSAALTVGSLVLSPSSGVLYPGTYGGFYATSYAVVYVAGRASVPPEVNLAARIILSHLWETQRASAGGPRPGGFGEADAGFAPGLGFAIPNRAKDLLAQHMRAPAVA